MFGLYFDDYDTPVFRPPSEANSFILRVTRGCAHNHCTFCAMYKDVPFTMCGEAEIAQQIGMAAQYYREHVRRIFLADGDALVLPTEKLLQLLNTLYQTFPKLQRVTSYASALDILRKSPGGPCGPSGGGIKALIFRAGNRGHGAFAEDQERSYGGRIHCSRAKSHRRRHETVGHGDCRPGGTSG